MNSLKMKAVVYPTPFQYLHPSPRSKPPSEITWNQVSRVQRNAHLVLHDLQLPQIVEIAYALIESLESFYNDCEYLRWMNHPVPADANYYHLSAYEDTPSPNDSPYSDIEIITGYCLEKMGLKYLPAQIFAVWSLVKLDEMAEHYHHFHKNPKRIIDLEMAGGALCEAMEALAAAYSVERHRRMHAAIEETEASTKAKTKKDMAKHAAAGKAKKRDPFKAVVLKKYTQGKYQSPHDASVKIWEDARQNPENYPDCPLVKSRGQATVYDWIREAYPEHCKPRRQSTPA